MSFDILKEECRTASFADAVRDLCDLEDRIYGGTNLFQFARTLERRHPVMQIFVGQWFPRSQDAELYGTVSDLMYQADTDFGFPIANFRLPIYTPRRSSSAAATIFDIPSKVGNWKFGNRNRIYSPARGDW